ncbi:MAG TPA: transglutaminase family protein [Alphaproteobacteria bacterium]|nr:transglutaminase family protein [Alphaproteobacteria bacterium]
MSSLESPANQNGMRYRVRHSTSCHYTDDILLAHHVLHLSPRPLARQHVLAHRIEIDPAPETRAEHLDYFGNPVTYLAVQHPHRSVVVTNEIEVVVAPPAPIDPEATLPWERVRDLARAAADDAARAAVRFAYTSPLIPELPELGEFARPSFAPGRPIAAAALDLSARIHREFVYDPVATTISTPLVEVLAQRRGVCQDFAHLAIGCLMALGLPARYVSGYLRTAPPEGAPRLVGADASHAWLSVWCGGETWLDLDPTNDRANPTDFVTLAWGRDYQDVSPMRGVIIGGGSQELVVEVDVEPLGTA